MIKELKEHVSNNSLRELEKVDEKSKNDFTNLQNLFPGPTHLNTAQV